MSRRRFRAVIASLAILVATLCAPQSAEAYTSAQNMVVTGHGWGHGHGMSQYGARGAATRGRTYQQILAFYYPHTTRTTTSSTRLVRVLLAELTTSKVFVKPRSGLTGRWPGHADVWDLSKAQPSADQWAIVPTAGGKSSLLYHLSGVWKTLKTVAGEIDFYAGGAPISVQVPGGSRSYRGTIGAVLPSPTATTRRIVNTLQLDQYVLGVIPVEMPSTWAGEALKAQAVAARTYAMYELAGSTSSQFQLYDDTRSQVYRGYSAEKASTNAAASATKGQILTYNGSPAFTEFASSNGGYELASAQGQPYLPSQPDPYERYGSNPNATWSASIAIAKLLANAQAKCANFGSAVQSIQPAFYRDANGKTTPWVSRVNVRSNTAVVCTYYGYEFRVTFGLKSANFTSTVA